LHRPAASLELQPLPDRVRPARQNDRTRPMPGGGAPHGCRSATVSNSAAGTTGDEAIMMRSMEIKAAEARKKAGEVFTRDRAKEAEVVKEREKAFAAQAQKTAKLKALRLARDAEEQAAAAAAPKPKPAKKPSRARA
jgi:hypothetical protein